MAEPPVLPLRSDLAVRGRHARDRARRAGRYGLEPRQGQHPLRQRGHRASRASSPGFALELAGRVHVEAERWCSRSACRATRACSACRATTCPACSTSSMIPTSTAMKRSSWSAPATRRSRTRSHSRAQNQVFIVNRSDEFTRVKDGNLKRSPRPSTTAGSAASTERSVARVEAAPARCAAPYVLVLEHGRGRGAHRLQPHHRPHRRDAAAQVRRILRHRLPGPRPDGAAGALTARYESSVPGLYVIGALGGYPLIKQAMNQGYEVVEYILGRDIAPGRPSAARGEVRARCPSASTSTRRWHLMQQRIAAVPRDQPPACSGSSCSAATCCDPAAGDVDLPQERLHQHLFHDPRGQRRRRGRRGPSSATACGAGRVLRRDEPAVRAGAARRRSMPGSDCVLIESPRREMQQADQLGRRRAPRDRRALHRARDPDRASRPSADVRRTEGRGARRDAQALQGRRAAVPRGRRGRLPAPDPQRLGRGLARSSAAARS